MRILNGEARILTKKAIIDEHNNLWHGRTWPYGRKYRPSPLSS